MSHINSLRITIALLATAGIFGIVNSAFADPVGGTVQRQKGGGGGGGGRASGGGGNAGGGQVHARREGVRTQTYVGRTQGGTFQSQPPVRQVVPPRPPSRVAARTQPEQQQQQRQQQQRRTRTVPAVIKNQRTFTKTSAGRHYDNGLNLRKGVKVGSGWQHEYFPHGYVHFPFYRQRYIAGACYYSPFSFYFGLCVPCIDISVCEVFPPQVNFIDVPAYSGNQCIGYQGLDNGNLINDPNLDQNEPGLNNALDELVETFQGGNIDGLVSLINPNMQVAIFMHGKYRYSLHANDYIDMTRDTIQSIQTVQFTLDYLHQRSPTVFCVSGQHTYNDKDGNSRSVYVSFVLQDIGGLWTLTQVGTSPDIMQKM